MAYFRCSTMGGGDGADLIVTCSSNFAGSTITCTDGTKTFTQTCPSSSPYTVTFESIPTGTWTISGVVSGQTFSTTKTITDFTEELNDIPDGATKTPTDDIQIWLNCANIRDKTTYTTISDVLSDTTTLLALISDSNAVDYMARSTTWASSVCANSNAMTYIGADNYCANALLDDDTWCDAIATSTYFQSVLNTKVPTMTSNTAPSGVVSAGSTSQQNYAWKAFDSSRTSCWAANTSTTWIQYKFTSAVRVVRVEFYSYFESNNTGAADFTITGSNDGSTFSSALTSGRYSTTKNGSNYVKTFTNDTSYEYYRANLSNPNVSQWYAICDMEFYGRVDV